jgi:hypothetical protein
MRELGCLSHPQYKFVCMLDHKVRRSTQPQRSSSEKAAGSSQDEVSLRPTCLTLGSNNAIPANQLTASKTNWFTCGANLVHRMHCCCIIDECT